HLSFINSGSGMIIKEHLQEELTDFIKGVIDKLEKSSIYGTLLQQEWEIIQQTNEEEETFCMVAASLGLDPYNISDYKRKQIMKAYKELPEEISGEFFTICKENKIESFSQKILKYIDNFKTIDKEFKELNKIRENVKTHYNLNVSPSSLPWKNGYNAAKILRKELNLNGDVIYELKDIEKAIKVGENKIKNYIEYDNELPNTLESITGQNKKESPVFVFSRKKHSAGMKFLLTRCLYNYFFSDHSEVLLITYSHSDIQKTNRAFAAEFLVPGDKLKKMIRSDSVTFDEIEEIA
ncbi:MAG: hypothetical protein ABEH43_07330, partial [Flavobacteriales bacterium]